MILKYEPSGVAPASSVLKTLICGILAALILPFLYIILNHLLPNIWISFFLAIGFAGLLALSVDFAVKIGKIRSPKVAISIGLLCGLLAFYLQWVFFIAVIYSDSGFTFDQRSEDISIIIDNVLFLFMHPNVLWECMVDLNSVGSFSIENSSAISGMLLWGIWAAEFLIIILGTLLFVAYGTVSKPFSEVDNRWMAKRGPFILPFILDKEELLHDFERWNFDILKERLEEYGVDIPFAEVYIYESTNDPQKYLSIVNVIQKSTKGKDKESRVDIVKYYPITNKEVDI